MSNRPHLYINSKGYHVTKHSYSGSESYNFCARKYYLERVQGWKEREERSSTAFGIALEHAVTFWHQQGQDTEAAVAEFVRLWAENQGKPLTYTKTDLDWDRLNQTGQEMIRLYAIRYPDMPYIIDNPMTAFQVERNVEVFPATKLQGIEFTAYLDIVATQKGSGQPLIVDMKTAGKEVPEFTELDPQLCSYAWVTGWRDVAFLWFRKMGRTISRGDSVTFLSAAHDFHPGDEAIVIGTDEFGLWVTNDPETLNELRAIEGKSKAAEAQRQAILETQGTHVSEQSVTKQRIEFKQVVIAQRNADDIGRSIKKDIIEIAHATEIDFFAPHFGVRFPNDRCPNCSMRGICLDRPALRDQLLERKQQDELAFVHIEGTE